MTLRSISRRRLVPLALALLLAGLTLALPAPAVHAATTYTVNVLTDTGSGSGTTGDLRYAITKVDAGSGGDTINITATGTITLTSALPQLTSMERNVTITGPGASLLKIDGSHTYANLLVSHNAMGGRAASISNLTIATWHQPLPAAVSRSITWRALTVTNSVLSTTMPLQSGGAIYQFRRPRRRRRQ